MLFIVAILFDLNLWVIVLIVAMLFDLMLGVVVLLFPTAAISVCPSVGVVVEFFYLDKFHGWNG